MLIFMVFACGSSADSAVECAEATGQVKVCATDASGQSLPGVSAYARQGSDTPIMAFVEEDGCVVLELPVGDWEIGLDDGNCQYKSTDITLLSCDVLTVDAVVDTPCVG